MKITFDPVKRDKTLLERALDFADAVEVFSGLHTVLEDDRFDWRDALHFCRFPTWPDGGDRLDAARTSASRNFDEVLSCKGRSTLAKALGTTRMTPLN